MEQRRLENKVALITGGASGMGASHARMFVEHGAQVVIADVADDAGRALADELGDAASFVHLDVTDSGQWAEAVATAESTFGRLNVLVNNAGVLGWGPLGEYTQNEWDRVIAINLTGPFLGMSAAVEALKRGKPASIINISSAAGLAGVPGAHAYTASKFGLRGLTKSAALELASTGIRVNSVHPGGVRTPMIGAPLEQSDTTTTDENLLRRIGEPWEISALVVFLASDESSFSTGSEFVADGGISAGLTSAG